MNDKVMPKATTLCRGWSRAASTPIQIAIGVPARARWAAAGKEKYSLLPTLVASIERTTRDDETAGRFEFSLQIGYDHDDPYYAAALNRDRTTAALQALMRRVPCKAPLQMCWEEQRGQRSNPCAIWSRLFVGSCRRGADYFFQLGDDVELLNVGWAGAFVQALQRSGNVGVAGPVDSKYAGIPNNMSGRCGGEPCIEQAFVHCTHARIFGTLFPAAFRNHHSDNWIAQAYGEKRAFNLDDVRINNRLTAGRRRYKKHAVNASAFRKLVADARAKLAAWDARGWVAREGHNRLI